MQTPFDRFESCGNWGAVQLAAAADSIADRNSSLSAGLIRNADAPAAVALSRTAGSSLAVRTITRVAGETVRNRLCTSSPFIAGIQTSITATSGRCACAYRRNASGSKNDSALQPSDERSRLVALTTDGSSSSKQMVIACLTAAAIKVRLPSSMRNLQR